MGMEEPIPFVAVEVPLIGDERRKNWAKIVESVDDTLGTGWAYQGEFVATGGIQDVPVGAVVVVYGEKGSRANPLVEARVYTVNGDGTMTFHLAAKGRAWARTLRDRVIELLDERDGAPIERSPWGPELVRYSDEAIATEARRRGLLG